MRRLPFLAILAAAVPVLPAATAHAAPPTYKIVDLGRLIALTSGPSAVNSRGVAVGTNQGAVRFTDGRIVSVPVGGQYQTAFDTNDAGAVVGSRLIGSTFRPYLIQAGKLTELGNFGGQYNVAAGVNAKNEVVGSAQTKESSQDHAFIWRNGHLIDLGTFGGSYSFAADIS